MGDLPKIVKVHYDNEEVALTVYICHGCHKIFAVEGIYQDEDVACPLCKAQQAEMEIEFT